VEQGISCLGKGSARFDNAEGHSVGEGRRKRTGRPMRSLLTTKSNIQSGRISRIFRTVGRRSARAEIKKPVWPTSKKHGPICAPSASADRGMPLKMRND